MIDGISSIGLPGNSTIDLSVRGAASIATAYLKIGDRVGAVALGDMLCWLSPSAGSDEQRGGAVGSGQPVVQQVRGVAQVTECRDGRGSRAYG